MACYTALKPDQTLAQRTAEIDAALKRLKRYLMTGQVQIKIAPNGAVGFAGWKDRDDLTDVCTVRSLSAEGSWEFRQALAKAEIMQGRRANLQASAAGWHTHDAGKTWSKH